MNVLKKAYKCIFNRVKNDAHISDRSASPAVVRGTSACALMHSKDLKTLVGTLQYICSSYEESASGSLKNDWESLINTVNVLALTKYCVLKLNTTNVNPKTNQLVIHTVHDILIFYATYTFFKSVCIRIA